ncbi:MAG: NAD(P)H-dependent oxidoreductase [Acholeplasmatales bacterium]|nr:NAD(P)H-dependent oxidoreductase [Acholeplasmatales bacterium]
MKSLIIYFSRADENYFGGAMKYIEKGNTEIAAEYIKDLTNASMFKVERKKEYSKGYMACIEEAKQEQRRNEKPELKAYLDDISDYDVIYIGAPIYWGTMPQPMFTELERLDFNGKIIMPFTTHEGSGLANVVNDIKKLAKGAIIKEGLPIPGSSVNDSKGKIEEWIKRNI